MCRNISSVNTPLSGNQSVTSSEFNDVVTTNSFQNEKFYIVPGICSRDSTVLRICTSTKVKGW